MIKAGVKILGSWLLVIDVCIFHNSKPMALVMSAVEMILMIGNNFTLRSFKFMLFRECVVNEQFYDVFLDQENNNEQRHE